MVQVGANIRFNTKESEMAQLNNIIFPQFSVTNSGYLNMTFDDLEARK